MAGSFISIMTVWAALLWTSGCASTAGETAGDYRTIRVEPRRNTDAARRENDAGLSHLGKGELDHAAAAFRRALNEDVEFGPAHNNLGKVHYRNRDWYKAAWEFEYARKLMPKHAEPRNNLGLVLEESGEFDRAADQYREAVALDPGDIQYRANLVRALIRRGDRTDEVRSLLKQVIEEDTRPEWVTWARQQQTIVSGRS